MKAIGTPGPRPASDPAALIACEAPEPALRSHDLRVQGRAVSLNPVDTKVRKSREAAEGQTAPEAAPQGGEAPAPTPAPESAPQ